MPGKTIFDQNNSAVLVNDRSAERLVDKLLRQINACDPAEESPRLGSSIAAPSYIPPTFPSLNSPTAGGGWVQLADGFLG